jgi:peptidoglycan/xylan/chitin deacetylase (PgdA/CDA1 family)
VQWPGGAPHAPGPAPGDDGPDAVLTLCRAGGDRLIPAHPEKRPVARRLAALLALAALLGAGCGSKADQGKGREHGPKREGREHAALPPVVSPIACTVRLPVLTYHRVHRYESEREQSIPDLTVEPQVFEASMTALKRRGFRSVTNRQVYDALFKGTSLPPKPVLITIDDGYRDAVTNVVPVLRRRGMVATFFVISRRLGQDEYLTENDLRALEAQGMEIGGHSSTHRDLTTLPREELERETAGSRRRIARILGHPVYFFAYPFGRHDPSVEAAVRRAGYSVAFTTESGSRLSSTNALTQPRLHVGRAATPKRVVALAEGSE